DVGAEPDVDSRLHQLVELHQSAPEKKIRSRTMRDVRLCGGDGGDLARVQMNAMTEHRLRREQSTLLIDMGVIARAHEKMMHLLDLLLVLGEMRLQISVESRRHFRRPAHEFFGTSNGESRTERIFQATVFGAVLFAAKPFAFEQRNGDLFPRL